MPFTRVRRHLRRHERRLPTVVSAHYRRVSAEMASQREYPTHPPEVLYHVTSLKNLPSILREGLRPSIRDTQMNYPFNDLPKRIGGKVFFSPNEELIERFAYVSPGRRRSDDEMVMLAVYTHGLPFYRGWSMNRLIHGGHASSYEARLRGSHEWFSTEPIPPDRIKIARILPSVKGNRADTVFGYSYGRKVSPLIRRR